MAFGVITDLTEAKLLILYILKYCGTKLPKSALDDIVISDDLIEYFVYTDALSWLFESGHIDRDEDGFYTFSHTGDEAISLFQKRIPLSVRERAIKVATVVISKAVTNSQVISESTEAGDGTYTVKLGILDDRGSPMFELRLSLPTQMQASDVCRRFRENPSGVFKGVLQLLT